MFQGIKLEVMEASKLVSQVKVRQILITQRKPPISNNLLLPVEVTVEQLVAAAVEALHPQVAMAVKVHTYFVLIHSSSIIEKFPHSKVL